VAPIYVLLAALGQTPAYTLESTETGVVHSQSLESSLLFAASTVSIHQQCTVVFKITKHNGEG